MNSKTAIKHSTKKVDIAAPKAPKLGISMMLEAKLTTAAIK